MSRTLCCLFALALVGATAADEPDPEPGSFRTGWDRPIDPDKDCKFRWGKGGLTIRLPGSHHDLDQKRNAPRLLRDLEGDFVATVRVGGQFVLTGPAAAGRRTLQASAGLVLMASDKTYALLERVEHGDGKRVATNASWTLRQNGSGRGYGRSFMAKEKYLRLERKGDKLLASISDDGKTWSEFRSFEVKLPAKVKLGLIARTTSTSPCSPHFDRFHLRQAKRK
jgi:regulation of enolase protein 1 (concanavalin A-like superfamily)